MIVSELIKDINQKVIKETREDIETRIETLKNGLKTLQNYCHHPYVIKTSKSDTGNWCKTDDSYWTEFKCPDCGKFWIEDK